MVTGFIQKCTELNLVEWLWSTFAPLGHTLCCIMLTLWAWGVGVNVCACVCVLLCKTLHFLPIILCRLTEHEEIKSLCVCDICISLFGYSH